MEEDVVIRIRGLKKSYTIIDPSIPKKRFSLPKKTQYPIFDGIDLDVRKGDIIGVLGRNGCGKSTFLKLVSEVLEPDEGTIEVKGKVASILELSMGFHPDLSGRDNIILRSELYGISREEVLKHLDEIVKYSDLGVFIDNPVRTYSSGMRSRLAFSVMVNVDADIFLVDEALSTGDMAFASKASEHLKNLVRSGKTVLFTSHSTSTIKRTCNRAIWLADHKIAMDGPADEVVDAYARSINDSFEETLSLAEGGSSAAQYRLSTFYRDGLGVEKNEEERMHWLKEAALREHPMAMAEIADIAISEGREEEAMKLYQQAAEAGNFEARRKYATMLGDTREDIEYLRGIMKDLASSGYPYDLYNYGNLMYRSALVPADYVEAFEYLSQASEKGWLEADVLLAQLYREGNGVERSMEKFVERLTYAAERGHPKAMSLLADAYFDGKYIERNPGLAFKWYLTAASTGNMKAQYQTAVMLSSGIGCEKDEEEAKKWFARYSSTTLNDSRKIAIDTMKSRRADIDITNNMIKAMSKNCNPQSMVSLAMKYESGKGFKKSEKAAVNLLEKAALAGGLPRTKLAEMYLNDKDDENDKKAFELLVSAAEYGDGGAMYRLAQMYKDGIVCEKDETKYRMYMRMAAERGNRDAKEVVMKWDDRIRRRKKDKESK